MSMKKFVLVLSLGIMAVVITAGRAYSETDSQQVQVMVQAAGNVDISADPTSYNFGTLQVNTSSNSADAIVLSNDGEVGVTLQRQYVETTSTGENWTIAASTGTNQYSLWMEVNSERIGLDTFEADSQVSNTDLVNLLNSAGEQAEIALGGTADLWFQIDMPSAVADTSQQTITLNVIATAAN